MWLRELLDRQALRYMARAGFLHRKDLQPAIAAHFASLIEQLETQDAAQDEEMEEDEEAE